MFHTDLTLRSAAVRSAAVTLVAAMCAVPCAPTAAAEPATQSAIVQRGYGGPEVLKLETVPVLEPSAGQVLIRVYAAGVNPVDWKQREGVNGRRLGTPPPADRPPALRIPGSDVSGVIARLGADVTDFKVGDAVAGSAGGPGMQGLNGAYSQYALATVTRLIRKPGKLTFAESAGLATAANTPALALYRLGMQAGQRLLVTGVAGGVGSSMAQLARAKGLSVIGTASARHNAFLKSIGVSEVIDYTQGDWTAKVRDVDAVFDTVGGADGERALRTLKKGGRFIGIASEAGEPNTEQCAAAGVECVALRPARPGDPVDRDFLGDVSRLAAEGQFVVHVDKMFPLEQAAAAQELSRLGHVEGKLILAVDAARASTR